MAEQGKLCSRAEGQEDRRTGGQEPERRRPVVIASPHTI